jgi:hypothetical protein
MTVFPLPCGPENVSFLTLCFPLSCKRSVLSRHAFMWPWKCLFSHFMFSSGLQEVCSPTSCFYVGLKVAVFSPPTFHWAWSWLFLHFTLFLGSKRGHLLVSHFLLILTVAIFSRFLVHHLYWFGLFTVSCPICVYWMYWLCILWL